MKKRTLAIGSLFGILLLALLTACSGELDSDSGAGAPNAAGGDGITSNLSLDIDNEARSFDATQAPAALLVPDSLTSSGGVGGPSTGESGPQLQSLLDRKIIRTATLDITVEDVAGGMLEVERIANNAGGFVSGSSLSVINPQDPDEERRQTGTVTIRVPSEAYASVMNQLRGVATDVEAESSDTSEVTAEYTDLESRLRTLEATEGRYLELLTQAETIPDILTMEDRLNSVRFEIEQVVGRLTLLDDLSDLSTIAVRLDLPPLIAETTPTESTGWAREAWDEAWATSEDALEVVGTVGIAAAVTLLWLAIPGAIALAGWRLFSNRRTDKTLQH
jgi:hypothetical protein